MHSSLTRPAWPMLCVTITIVNSSRRPRISVSMRCVPSASSAEQGSSIRITRGLSGNSRAMHSFCCCSSVRTRALLAQLVLDVLPQKHVFQSRLDDCVALARGAVAGSRPCDLHAEQHVVVDRNRQRVGPLKHHAHRLAQLAQRDIGVVDVLAEDRDLAGRRHVAVALVDAVEAAQERGLAAARRADQRGDARRREYRRRCPSSA